MHLSKQQIEQISLLLAELDLWIATRERDQLNNDCRESGNEFFAYMKSRGVYSGEVAQIIIEATGSLPSKIWKVEDAEQLKTYIRAYQGSVIESRINPANPVDITRRHWEV